MSVFTWVASYGSRMNIKPNATPIKFGDGYEQRVESGLNSAPRKWELTFANKPTIVAAAIEAFLKARRAVESFDWTDCYGEPGRWVCREWSSQPTSPRHRTITCTFEEVFEAA